MIIDRYLSREISKPMLAIGFILIIIFVGAGTAQFLADANAGMLWISEVVKLILLRNLISLELMLPIALYLGIVAGLGRLYTDSEITALHAAGISEARLIWPVLGLSLLCALLVGYLSLVARPWAYQNSYRIQAEAAIRFNLDDVEAGRFYQSADASRTIFVDKIDRDTDQLEGFFMTDAKDDRTQVTYADRAYQQHNPADTQPVWILLHGHIYMIDKKGTKDVVISYDRMEMRLDIEKPSQEYKRKAASSLTLADSSDSRDIAELQWRLSRPVATILLGLLGVPMSRATPRQGKYVKILLAIVVFILYYYLSAMAMTWVDKGKVGAFPGLWWVDALMAGLVLLLLILRNWRFRWKSPSLPVMPDNRESRQLT
ncbi:MAG: LPS export ABC transporter permease LptF [Candidatus Competibacteraceae bacterium]